MGAIDTGPGFEFTLALSKRGMVVLDDWGASYKTETGCVQTLLPLHLFVRKRRASIFRETTMEVPVCRAGTMAFGVGRRDRRTVKVPAADYTIASHLTSHFTQITLDLGRNRKRRRNVIPVIRIVLP